MSFNHTVVWLDHLEAHVIGFNNELSQIQVIKSKSDSHLHHKSGSVGSGHAGADQNYLHVIVKAITGSREVLVTGPGSAKLDLIKHVHHHDAEVAKKIIGVETTDHPTDGQLLAYAKKYFLKADNML